MLRFMLPVTVLEAGSTAKLYREDTGGMDVISHALWAGAAGLWLRRRRPEITVRMVGAMVVLGAAPDIVQMLPVVAASAGEGNPLRFLYVHVTALPGSEPVMPAWAHAASHHLHCALHSVVIAALATIVVRVAKPAWLPALLGWWLHIALDVPTHSADYYPVPIFYPLSYWGVKGIAWTEPAVLAVNFAALAIAYAGLSRMGRRKP